MEEAWKQQSPKPRMPNSRQGPQRDNSNEREMDVAELRSYLIIIQTSKATTGFSMSFPEETPENREMWSCVGAASIHTGSASSPLQERLGKVWRAQGGKIPPEWQCHFSPKHQLKTKDTGLPSLTDVVGTGGDFSLGKLRSPSAYSLTVRAALRNAFVPGL